MQKKIYDCIIVGQGIAGTVLSWLFLKQGKSILIVDSREKPSSSEIALGIYNPVVFRRMTKSWKADEIIPVAENFYSEMESDFGVKVLHKNNVIRVFSSKDERTFWEKKMKNGIAKKFLGPVNNGSPFAEKVSDEYGSGETLNSGWLDTAKLLSVYRKFLRENNLLLEKKFDYKNLDASGKKLIWENINAEKVIFCEGSSASKNPYFSNLPFSLTKGEMLTIRIPGFFPDNIISKGVYILREYDDTFKVGATYDWDDLTQTPTEKGKTELIEKLKKTLKCRYEILDHAAAVRPTVKDRRPLIGLNSKDKRIGIFNGMGTKGVMLAPYFAKQFLQHIDNGFSLDVEADINRFGQY